MLKIEHGTKSFGTQNIFTDISLTIDHPGLFALWGESGSGKSTLLNIIAGFDRMEFSFSSSSLIRRLVFSSSMLLPPVWTGFY